MPRVVSREGMSRLPSEKGLTTNNKINGQKARQILHWKDDESQATVVKGKEAYAQQGFQCRYSSFTPVGYCKVNSECQNVMGTTTILSDMDIKTEVLTNCSCTIRFTIFSITQQNKNGMPKSECSKLQTHVEISMRHIEWGVQCVDNQSTTTTTDSEAFILSGRYLTCASASTSHPGVEVEGGGCKGYQSYCTVTVESKWYTYVCPTKGTNVYVPWVDELNALGCIWLKTCK